jgi:adenylate cyclase
MMRFSRCRLLGVTFTLSRWLVLAAAPNVVATWSFGVGIVGFRADTLPGFGLPEAANPIAALSRYLDSRFVDSADVFLRHS